MRKRLALAVGLIATVLAVLGVTAVPASAYYYYDVNPATPSYQQYAKPGIPLYACYSTGINVAGINVVGLAGYSTQTAYAVAHIDQYYSGAWHQVSFSGTQNPGLYPGGKPVYAGRTTTFAAKWFSVSASGYYRIYIEVDWRSGGKRVNNVYYGAQYTSEVAGKYVYGGNPPYCAAGAWAT